MKLNKMSEKKKLIRDLNPGEYFLAPGLDGLAFLLDANGGRSHQMGGVLLLCTKIVIGNCGPISIKIEIRDQGLIVIPFDDYENELLTYFSSQQELVDYASGKINSRYKASFEMFMPKVPEDLPNISTSNRSLLIYAMSRVANNTVDEISIIDEIKKFGNYDNFFHEIILDENNEPADINLAWRNFLFFDKEQSDIVKELNSGLFLPKKIREFYDKWLNVYPDIIYCYADLINMIELSSDDKDKS